MQIINMRFFFIFSENTYSVYFPAANILKIRFFHARRNKHFFLSPLIRNLAPLDVLKILHLGKQIEEQVFPLCYLRPFCFLR